MSAHCTLISQSLVPNNGFAAISIRTISLLSEVFAFLLFPAHSHSFPKFPINFHR